MCAHQCEGVISYYQRFNYDNFITSEKSDCILLLHKKLLFTQSFCTIIYLALTVSVLSSAYSTGVTWFACVCYHFSQRVLNWLWYFFTIDSYIIPFRLIVDPYLKTYVQVHTHLYQSKTGSWTLCWTIWLNFSILFGWSIFLFTQTFSVTKSFFSRYLFFNSFILNNKEILFFRRLSKWGQLSLL